MHERSYTPLFNLNGYESTLVTGLIYDNRTSFIRLEIRCLVKRNLMGRLHLIRRLNDWQYFANLKMSLVPFDCIWRGSHIEVVQRDNGMV